MPSLLLALALLPAADADAKGLLWPDVTLAKEVRELRSQTGLLNSEITGLRVKVDRLEATVNVALSNRSSSNTGSQVFSGDVGLLSVVAFAVTLLGGLWLWWRYRRIVALIEMRWGDDG